MQLFPNSSFYNSVITKITKALFFQDMTMQWPKKARKWIMKLPRHIITLHSSHLMCSDIQHLSNVQSEYARQWKWKSTSLLKTNTDTWRFTFSTWWRHTVPFRTRKDGDHTKSLKTYAQLYKIMKNYFHFNSHVHNELS